MTDLQIRTGTARPARASVADARAVLASASADRELRRTRTTRISLVAALVASAGLLVLLFGVARPGAIAVAAVSAVVVCCWAPVVAALIRSRTRPSTGSDRPFS